jgi:hypothetical protein
MLCTTPRPAMYCRHFLILSVLEWRLSTMENRKTNHIETEDERRQRQIELNQAAIALLDSWLVDDSESPEEQRIALEALMRGIDENRPEGRKLFTEYLK